jgi:hypothetical protein
MGAQTRPGRRGASGGPCRARPVVYSRAERSRAYAAAGQDSVKNDHNLVKRWGRDEGTGHADRSIGGRGYDSRLAEFRLALAGVIAPHDCRLGPTSRLLTEARRELAACQRLLEELDRQAGRR